VALSAAMAGVMRGRADRSTSLVELAAARLRI
jgi:hypothetical protein